MSETDGLDTAGSEPPGVSPGPGALLREAREARGLTIADVAASLKMSPRQIEAIEAEEFSRLSGATFVRGFIRNYAKLLRLDAAPLLAVLEEKAELPQAELTAPGGSGVRMPSGADGHRSSSLVAGVLALALLGLALALYFDVVDLGALLGPRAEPSRAAVDGPRVEAQVVQPIAAVVPTPQSEAVPGVQPAAQPERPARRPGDRQLVFSFEADSWVEVKDGDGRIILSQLNRKGTNQVIEGHPPFQVVIGNADRVRLHYDEEVVDLRPHTRVEVARLTLD